ncbi:MAG: shikimate kinase [Eubacteriales bacterium]
MAGGKKSYSGKNIVLIGMSGCGKSRIARILAKKLKFDLVDVDSIIRSKYGNITDLFSKGEEYFRDIETKEVFLLEGKKDTVIATGGGCVTREENMHSLKKNGIIVYIKRSSKSIIETSNLSGRPLLAGGMDNVEKLFLKRRHLYDKYADLKVTNEGDISLVIGEILTKLRRY